MSGIARCRSAASSVSSAGAGVGEGVAGEAEDVWPRAATQKRIVRLALRTRRTIGRTDVSLNRDKSNVAPEMAAFELDLADGGVSQIPCGGDRDAECGDRQNPAAAAHDFSVFPSCPGMENLHVLHLRAFVEPGDFLARPDVARIAGGSHHDSNGGAFVYFDFHFVYPPVDGGFEEWQQVAFQARQNYLRLGVAETAVE